MIYVFAKTTSRARSEFELCFRRSVCGCPLCIIRVHHGRPCVLVSQTIIFVIIVGITRKSRICNAALGFMSDDCGVIVSATYSPRIAHGSYDEFVCSCYNRQIRLRVCEDSIEETQGPNKNVVVSFEHGQGFSDKLMALATRVEEID